MAWENAQGKNTLATHDFTTKRTKNEIWTSVESIPDKSGGRFLLFCQFNASSPHDGETSTTTETSTSAVSKPSTVNECEGYNPYDTDGETSGAADWSVSVLIFLLIVIMSAL